MLAWKSLKKLFIDTTIVKVIHIPQCKIESPHSFIHAHFIEERLRYCCSEIEYIEVDQLTGNIILHFDAEHMNAIEHKLMSLKDRLGNTIKPCSNTSPSNFTLENNDGCEVLTYNPIV